MKGYKKGAVEFHNDRLYSPRRPAINVKVYSFPSAAKIAARFNCSESQAEKAGEFAFNMACRAFWESVGDIISKYFPGVKWYQGGRSGGWLELESDPKTWDGIRLNHWALLERAVKAEVKYLTSESVIFEDIEANKWYMEGAEEFNFIDSLNGPRCIAEEKQKARELLTQNGIVGIRL